MSETDIMRDIRQAVNATERASLFRNNVGFDEAKSIKYGLSKGSADLIGFMHKTGQFISVEVKTPKGRLDNAQKAWMNFVIDRGGIAIVARSVGEALVQLGLG